MSVPPRPDPPVVGKVTHNSIELYWKAPEASRQGKGDSRVRYCVQEEELGPKSKGFGNVYSGYSTMWALLTLYFGDLESCDSVKS